MGQDMEKRTAQYIQVRAALERLKEKQELERKPLQEIQERLAGIIQQFMTDNKLENLKTEAGTCYTSTRFTASLSDPDAFMRFVIETQNFDLLDRRANATAVKDYVEQHNVLPTGVSLNALQTVGVRRPTGKSKN